MQKKDSILFVDDEDLLLGSYHLFFSDDYQVFTAESPSDALDILKSKNDFSLIISDYNMPGMNGIEFFSIVKEKYPEITRILLTAHSDVSIVINAVNEINIFRILIKADELSKLLKAVCDGIEYSKLIRSEKKLKTELEQRNRQFERDLLEAAHLQQAILPTPSSFGGYSFFWQYEPSMFLSGDSLNYFQFEDWIIFYVLDVAGHGIPASMLSFSIARMINSEKIPSNPILEIKDGEYKPKSPSKVLDTLNKIFLTKDDDSQFFAITYGLINCKTGDVTITNAGNKAPIYLSDPSNSKSPTNVLEIKGLFCGVLEESVYEEKHITLKKNEKLVVYTDGLTELENSTGDYFGDKRILKFFTQNRLMNPEDMISGLEFETNRWREALQPRDDITVLVIEKC